MTQERKRLLEMLFPVCRIVRLQKGIILSLLCPHFALGAFGLIHVDCLLVGVESKDLAPALRGNGAYLTDAVHTGTNSPICWATRHCECAFV